MKSRTAALSKIRLTGTFGKACAMTALCANLVLFAGIFQNSKRLYSYYQDREHKKENPEWVAPARLTNPNNTLSDSKITLGESFGVLVVTLGAGATAVGLANSRRRQIHAFNEAVAVPAGASPPVDKNGKPQKYWNSGSYNSSYNSYSGPDFLDGYIIGSWMNGGSRSGGGGSSSSSSGGFSLGDSDDAAAIPFILALAVLVALTAVSVGVSVKATKENFFKQPKINFGSKTDHLKLEPLP